METQKDPELTSSHGHNKHIPIRILIPSEKNLRAPPVSNSSCVFIRCQLWYASYCTVLLYFSRYCTVTLKCFLCVCYILFV